MKKIIVLDETIEIQLEIPNNDIEWESISKEERDRIEEIIDDATIDGDLDGHIILNDTESNSEIILFWKILFDDDE